MSGYREEIVIFEENVAPPTCLFCIRVCYVSHKKKGKLDKNWIVKKETKHVPISASQDIMSRFSLLVGSLRLTVYEKSCAIPSQCGVSGEKQAAGLNFNYTNVCCDTDLCNGAVSVSALSWRAAVLCLLPALYVILVWSTRLTQPLWGAEAGSDSVLKSVLNLLLFLS